MSSVASPAPISSRVQRPSPMGGGMELGDRQMPQPPAPSPFPGTRGAYLAQRQAPAPQNFTIPQPTQPPQFLQPEQGLLQRPVMPPTYAGAQSPTKMGGGYPAMAPPPVSGNPGMAGGGMTPTTQPVGVSVPVDVQPFISGGEGGFSTGGSYGTYATPLRGSNLQPEDYADLYGGRFSRGG